MTRVNCSVGFYEFIKIVGARFDAIYILLFSAAVVVAELWIRKEWSGPDGGDWSQKMF